MKQHMVGVWLVLGTMALTGNAQGGESSRLQYVRAEGAKRCPDEPALRAAVAARLGYDPFVAWAKTTVVTTITGGAEGLRARIYLAGEDGRARGFKSFDISHRAVRSAHFSRCPRHQHCSRPNGSRGVKSAASRFRRSAETTAPSAPTAPTVEASRSTPADPTQEKSSPVQAVEGQPTHLDLGVGSLLATGVAPALAVGGPLRFGSLSGPTRWHWRVATICPHRPRFPRAAPLPHIVATFAANLQALVTPLAVWSRAGGLAARVGRWDCEARG